MSLFFSGASLLVWFVICCWGVSLPVGKASRAGLSAGFVISFLGVSFLVGMTFS